MPDEQPTYEEDGGQDLTFGDVAVGMGLVTLEQIRTAMEHVGKEDERGYRKTLGAVLIDQGVLTVEEVRLVLSEQGKEMLVCSNPDCRRRYNVRDYKSEQTYKCKACEGRLGLPGATDRIVRFDAETGDSSVDWREVMDREKQRQDAENKPEA